MKKSFLILVSVFLLSSVLLAQEFSVNVGMLSLPGKYKTNFYTQKFVDGVQSPYGSLVQDSKDFNVNVMLVNLSLMKATEIEALQYGMSFGFSSADTVELDSYYTPAYTSDMTGIFRGSVYSFASRKYDYTMDVNVMPVMGQVSYAVVKNEKLTLNAGIGVGVYAYLINTKEKSVYTFTEDVGDYKEGETDVYVDENEQFFVKPAMELNITGNYALTERFFVGLNVGVVNVADLQISKSYSKEHINNDYDDLTEVTKNYESEESRTIGGLGYKAGIDIGVRF